MEKETDNNSNEVKDTPVIAKPTDAETDGLKGKVKQVMQTCYKAHLRSGIINPGKIESDYTAQRMNFIVSYNEKGAKVQEQLFGTDGHITNTYNDKAQVTDTIQINEKYNQHQITQFIYNERGNLLETIVRNADGSLYYRTHDTYNDAGKQLDHFHYMGNEERIIAKVIYEYNENGDLLSVLQYNQDGNIHHRSLNKYDASGKVIEWSSESMEEKNIESNMRFIYKFNSHGDCIETHLYKGKNSIPEIFYDEYEYDSEGNKIIPERPPYNPPAKAINETEEVENDAEGNWIKKTTFYNKLPVNIFIREINYFVQGAIDKESFVHQFSIDSTEVIEVSNPPEELEDEEAKWLAEAMHNANDNFPVVRYYTFLNKELPSVVSYIGPNIEAFALLAELKENMGAQEVHSYSSVWKGQRERLSRYTLTFPTHFGYMLQTIGIGAQVEDEFEMPENIERHNDGYVYISQFYLLRPSDASGKRNEYFEEELSEYITKCTLNKKPDKPVINMIEVTTDGFIMKEHAVDDDFEISDLDVNYGYGFEEFHNELMKRFNSSTKGLILFHGEPGTGKTYYIRHLLRKMVSNKKVVIYIPPNMVDHLVEPMFMTFLASEVQEWSANGNFCVLLIEDAEPLLAKRQEGVRIQGVTNLLNMSDGLLNDMLNLQIICTFNVDLRKLDSALLRPGRLVARKEFKALSELDANLLAQRLGITHHFNAPATLGEIYAMRKNKNTLIHDVESDRDASTLIDDLL